MAKGEDTSNHPNRKVHRGRWVDPDPTPPHGTPRPSMDFISPIESDEEPTSESELEAPDKEELMMDQKAKEWRNEGLGPDWRDDRGYL